MISLIDRLREDAEYHREIAHQCDCDPKDTVNWKHALTADEAADRIAELESQLAAERERCAKLCEESELAFDIDVWCNSTKKEMTANTARALAAVIRGETK